jgi:hypothetical protein
MGNIFIITIFLLFQFYFVSFLCFKYGIKLADLDDKLKKEVIGAIKNLVENFSINFSKMQ